MSREDWDREDEDEARDRQIRSDSMRDRTRIRKPVRFEVDTVVAQWPCRTCHQPTDLTTAGADRFEQFNKMLRARGERPLSTGEVLFCTKCEAEKRKHEADANRRKVDGLAEKIRALKADPPPPPEVERVLVKAIEAAGHPDVKGLLDTIKAKREAGDKKKPARARAEDRP
jgi:hypothetical protein